MSTPEEFFESYQRAVESLDRDAMLALYAPDVRVFDAMEPPEYADLSEWALQVNAWFTSVASGAHAVARDVRVFGGDGDLAVFTGHVEFTGVLPDGQEAGVECRVTMVLQRDGDSWKIVHEHSSIPMSEDEMDDHDHDHDHDHHHHHDDDDFADDDFSDDAEVDDDENEQTA